jgi:predicted ATP-grasp superfamily ATP-dependent carboligase/protein-tyrosine-phosphatase
MPRPVIILNAAEHVQLAVARSLHRHGIEVTIADINGSANCPPSRAIRHFVKLPSIDDTPDEFVNALTELILSRHYDTIFPCSDPGLVAVSKCYEHLRSLLYVACPPPDVVARVLNKSLTLEAADKCNIAVPVTYRIRDHSALEAMRGRLRFPIIAKPASKIDERFNTFKSRYFATLEELARAFRSEPQLGSLCLFQQYCDGVGVGIEVLMHKGQPLAIFQHRRLKELPITGGGSVTAVSEPADPLLTDQAVALLRQIGWEGVAMVEFRYDRTERKAVLMEVNGRYWGSLPLAIHAGMDFPFYEWQLVHGEKPEIPASYRHGVRTRWLFGDIQRLQSLLAGTQIDEFPRPSVAHELIRFIRDFAPTTHPAVWSWSDPLPALYQLRSALKGLVKALISRFTRFDEYRHLDWRSTKFLLRERLLHTARLKRYLPPRDFSGLRTILFVCHGNLIRSPMAAALLRKHLAYSGCEAGIEVFSAGLTQDPQEQPDKRAKLAAEEFGISLARHCPVRLTSELIESADVIFLMDRLNEARMFTAYPEAKSKMFLLGSLNVGESGGPAVEICDPGLGDIAEVRRCYLELDVHVRKLANMLLSSGTDRKSLGRPLQKHTSNDLTDVRPVAQPCIQRFGRGQTRYPRCTRT